MLKLSKISPTKFHELKQRWLFSYFRTLLALTIIELESDAALECFPSCWLTFFSKSSPLTCGVPQGYVLGPLVFFLYFLPLNKVINRFQISYCLHMPALHFYVHPWSVSIQVFPTI